MMLPSDFPYIKQFSHYYMQTFLSKMQVLVATLLITRAKKITFYQKFFYILKYSGVETCPWHDVAFKFSGEHIFFSVILC